MSLQDVVQYVMKWTNDCLLAICQQHRELERCTAMNGAQLSLACLTNQDGAVTAWIVIDSRWSQSRWQLT